MASLSSPHKSSSSISFSISSIISIFVFALLARASLTLSDSAVPSGVDFETWLGPAPKRTFNEKRFHGLWRMFWDYGGGLMTDMGFMGDECQRYAKARD